MLILNNKMNWCGREDSNREKFELLIDNIVLFWRLGSYCVRVSCGGQGHGKEGRCWFSTKAEQAHQPPHFIAALVKQKREGMTLGRYSAGPQAEQVRAAVEGVQLLRLC